MSRPLSPIERMIDEACGVPAGFIPSPIRRIRCPSCLAEKSCMHHYSDPKGTKLIVARCPKCVEALGFDAVTYFDTGGTELFRP